MGIFQSKTKPIDELLTELQDKRDDVYIDLTACSMEFATAIKRNRRAAGMAAKQKERAAVKRLANMNAVISFLETSKDNISWMDAQNSVKAAYEQTTGVTERESKVFAAHISQVFASSQRIGDVLECLELGDISEAETTTEELEIEWDKERQAFEDKQKLDALSSLSNSGRSVRTAIKQNIK